MKKDYEIILFHGFRVPTWMYGTYTIINETIMECGIWFLKHENAIECTQVRKIAQR